MGTIWVKEFSGGLDARRLLEAAEQNILIRARNGHINRGGEFEQRKAFVPEYELPAGTVGLARTTESLYVFGHGPAPAGVPAGVTYQRLQHPETTGTALARITSAEIFKGKLYVAAEFADGAIYHFYDGEHVTDWYDGRARASFEVTGGENTPGTAASGSFQITSGSDTPTAATGSFTIAGGTAGAGNEITAVIIDGVDALGAAVEHTGDNASTAAAVAAQITSHTSNPDYSATADGATVTITAAPGAAANGRTVTVGVNGDVTVGTTENMAGGTDAGVITAVRVDGVNLIGAPVAYDTDNPTTAAAVANAINTHTSTPNYTAEATAGRVEITAAAVGSAANGRAISTTLEGEVETDNHTSLSGGQNAYISEVTGIQVNGVPIMGGPVQWADSNSDTAAAIAAAINDHTSSPDYEASSAGPAVNIVSVDPGAEPNGWSVDVTRKNGFSIAPASGLTMSDGADTEDAYQPGPFVKVVGSKMYALSGSVMHFSGIQQPDKWTPDDAVGAGFIDLSSESSEMERLTALARYQEYVAVFADSGIQVWYVDPDPELYRLAQMLGNTGTSAPNSVTQFGDEDVFYLDESGLRSLRSRATLNVAVTTDVGVPVDALITERLRGMTQAERLAVFGLIEPATGRFWLVMGDCVFVFTFFQSANVSAWSTYDTTDPAGEPFVVEYVAVHDRRVFLRAGDTIYCYGGLSGEEHDETEAEVWLPYLDADRPTAKKSWDGIDVACTGQWEVWAAMHPAEGGLETEEMIGQVWRTTYNENRLPMHHDSTHVSPRFRSVGPGPHKLSSVVVHYAETGRED